MGIPLYRFLFYLKAPLKLQQIGSVEQFMLNEIKRNKDKGTRTLVIKISFEKLQERDSEQPCIPKGLQFL